MNFKDYYWVLGVDRDATMVEIKRAFRRLAFRYHPDQNPGDTKQAEEKFKEINEAYEVVGDEAKRGQYDYLMNRIEQRQSMFAFNGATSGNPSGDISMELLRVLVSLDIGFNSPGIRRSHGCRRGYGCRRDRSQFWR